MQKVAIVNAGEWGGLRQDHGAYHGLVETLKESLKEAKRSDGQFAAQVRVVPSTQDALFWVGTSGGCIIYITRGMIREAKKVAAEYSDIRVVLLTGTLPEGEVVLVRKGRTPMAYIEDIVLG